MHLLTIKAFPGVPEPALEESEPALVDSEELLEPLEEPAAVVVAGAGAAAAGDGAGPGPGHDGCFHGDGAETVVRAKNPMTTRVVMADPKERIFGHALWESKCSIGIGKVYRVYDKY